MFSELCTGGECCVVKVFRESRGKDSLLQHFLTAVCNSSDCSSLQCKEEPTDEHSESGDCQDQSGSRNRGFLYPKLGTVTEDLCCSCNASAASTYGHLKGFPILLAEIKMKLNTDVRIFICDMTVLRKVKVCLDMTATVQGSGTASPYLYVWTDHSSFVWHLEPGCADDTIGGCHSSTKLWFLIPGRCVTLFHYFLIHHLNLKVGETTCRNFIYNDASNGDPRDIEASMVAKDDAELRILCHHGCVPGPTIVEGAVYAKEVRFAGGLSSFQGFHQVSLHHPPPCAIVQRQSASSISGFQYTVEKNILYNCTETLPTASNDGTLFPHDPQGLDIVVENGHHCLKIEMDQNDASSTDCKSPKRTTLRHRQPQREVDCMMLVECPQCDKSFKGSRDRLQRLLIHATKCHKSMKKKLVCDIINRYYALLPAMITANIH